MSVFSLLLLAQLATVPPGTVSAAPSAPAAKAAATSAPATAAVPAAPAPSPAAVPAPGPAAPATAAPSPVSATAQPVPPAPPKTDIAADDARAADADADDDSEGSDEVNTESAELEAVRALEETALSSRAKPAARMRQLLSRLGLASPLRSRMEDAAEDDMLREDALYELGLVTNLADFDVAQVRDQYDIPVEMQPLVAQYIEFFQGPGRKWFRKWMGRSRRYIPMLQPILAQQGVPRDTVYLAMIESGFSTQAYSRARAAGMWQFITSTGKLFGLHQDFWIDERRDFVKATGAAAHYLRQLHAQLGDWYLAWAGYNAGGGRVQRAIDRQGTHNFWELSTGRILAKETQHYVPKLIAAALVAKHPQAFGFQESEFDSLAPVEYEEVHLEDPTDLEVIARAAQVPVELVRELNPELKRWCTPPASKARPYILRLPKGSSATFAENFPKIAPKERLTFAVHHVRRGDTLSQIAVRYHSAPEPILQLNHLRSARRLRVNSDLVIPVPRGKAVETAALDRQVERARRHGFTAPRPEDEVPAGTPRPSTPGEVITEQFNGKTRVTYSVQEGDNLWTIGQRFQVGTEELRGWNNLSRKSRLQIGTRIVIWPRLNVAAASPAGTAAVASPAGAPPAAAPGIGSGAPPSPAATPAVAGNPGAPAGSVAAAERPKVHLLGEGETLWSISQRYGIPIEDLKRWNRIKRARNLRAGMQLSLVSP